MAKELPYFRFTASEWLNDDISLESYELKGLFADVCAYYWTQDCDCTLDRLKKKFSNATILLQQLVESDIIKHENKHDKIKIDFLLIQYDILSEKRKLRQDAGSKGGNAKAMLKQKDSYKDKDNNKIDIDIRKLKFADTLKPFLVKYGKDMMNDFYAYWTEPNKSNTKFRQELEKVWDINKRLLTWSRNDKGFNKKQISSNNDTGLL
jgi:hypothetical protein